MKARRGSKPRGNTPPRQFRLGAETLSGLDAIAAWMTERSGKRCSRADAVRYSAKATYDLIQKNLADMY
jgi:hypothetical protein